MNYKTWIIVLTCIFLSVILGAENTRENDIKISSFKNSINSCPGGLLFGVYSINYERMLTKHNGLAVRFDYENISEKYSGDKFEAKGLAFIANYRRHFKPSLHSFYLGAYTRYRVYDGTGEDGALEFDFDRTEVTLGLNAGKRWVWSSGFNINFMLGYGIDFTETDVEDTFDAAYDKFTDKYSFEGPMLGELSIGFAF